MTASNPTEKPTPAPTIGQLVSTVWSDDLPLDLLLRRSDTPQARACVSILLAAEEPLLSLPPKDAASLVVHLTAMCQSLLEPTDADLDGVPGAQEHSRDRPAI